MAIVIHIQVADSHMKCSVRGVLGQSNGLMSESKLSIPWSLSGRAALVTGSSRGIGWAIASQLARAGAAVMLTGRDPAPLAERVAELETGGATAAFAAYDVRFENDVSATVSKVVERWGRLDILVNNAAMMEKRPLAETSTARWQAVIDVDLTAVFVHSREAVDALAAGGHGRIINISSIQGLHGSPMMHAYAAAKHGVIGLTKALAAELAPLQVTVNAIAPGPFGTAMNSQILADPAAAADVARRVPLGRWGVPEEIGAAALYLASDAAAYVTGTVLVVDGGKAATM